MRFGRALQEVPLACVQTTGRRFVGLWYAVRLVAGVGWRSRLTRAVILLGIPLVLLVYAAAWGAESDRYRVSFEGIPDKSLRRALEAASDCVQLRKRAPVAPRALRLRAERDRVGLLQVMQANGYYDATITFDLDVDATPVRLVFHVEARLPCLLAAVAIHGPDGQPVGPGSLSDIGLALGERATAGGVIASQRRLLEWFGRRGYPFPEVTDRRVVVDRAAHTMAVTFVVDPGPTATFGTLTITGLVHVDERVVRMELPWRTGDAFNGDLLGQFRARLVATGQFSLIQVSTSEAVDERGQVGVQVRLAERKPRTAAVGLSYRTDEGFGTTLSWQHRNLLGHAERFSFSAAFSGIVSALDAEFRKPHFRGRRKTLILDVRVAEEKPDAYTSRSVGASALVKRHLTPSLDVGAGLAYKYSEVTQGGEKNVFSLISVPGTLDWDTSDDWLSPSRGGRLGAQITPFYDVRSPGFGFVKGRLQYSRYVPLSRGPNLVLAGRVALGSIVGAEHDSIPADERFYAGGGGSIRGYAYQTVSPLDGTDPIGGKSLFELSLELRIQLSDAVGLVPFIDGGNAFVDSAPDPGGDLLWGAGIGLRYATPIGPIRFDVGFPLDRRDGMDDSFQIYVSLGQSF
ncbi:MAG: outer membrane protein assembly factor [Verrucomicrobia bacterium]|nr:outer membrane protein assembly factor [Verrucomicrobiota bacterium]